MNPAQFPWRRLGELLVEGGLLSAAELERALASQRRSGRLLGQVLVEHGYVGGASLACALAEQHGVGLRPSGARPRSDAAASLPRAVGDDAPWRPLGRVLVELGLVSEAELETGLAEQRRQPARRLGEILVADGFLTGRELAVALAEQQGVALDGDELEPAEEPAAPGAPVYRVYTVAYDPVHRPDRVLYRSASFLEAADFACDFVQREHPPALEIEQVDGLRREPVWTYSEARAAAEAAARRDLVDLYGFDPVRWDARRQVESRSRRDR